MPAASNGSAAVGNEEAPADFSTVAPHSRRGVTIRPAMELNDLDPAMRLAISVIQRCVAGQGVELQQKVLVHYEPTLHRCHDNVREFVEKFPECKHVFGFLVAQRKLLDDTLVIAHSAVETPEGSLVDITPSESEFAYPFVRHVGTPEEFDLIAADPFMIEVPNSLVRQFALK
jgi:hypothetical protein